MMTIMGGSQGDDDDMMMMMRSGSALVGSVGGNRGAKEIDVLS